MGMVFNSYSLANSINNLDKPSNNGQDNLDRYQNDNK